MGFSRGTTRKLRALTLYLLAAALSTSSTGLPASATMPAAPEQPGAQQPPGRFPAPARGAPTDAEELERFIDGVMAAHLRDHEVAGATVAVVRGGSLLFSKGYGHADADGRNPVDPATTLFRIGSVTKPFTWVAVLQLRDQGLLDLDADVNQYLDFQIPGTYEEPITLRHILTHPPGFEDRVFGLFGITDEVTRGEWLRANMPARVRPPGTQPSYSNYASALAGYIVERVSGMPWESYVEAHILEPLRMTYATARHPLPQDLAPHMSGGFASEDGQFVAKPFEHLGAMAPAGWNGDPHARVRIRVGARPGTGAGGVERAGQRLRGSLPHAARVPHHLREAAGPPDAGHRHHR